MKGPIFKELHEIPELDNNWVNQYIKENYANSLNEMARVNVKEFAGYFPCNKFNIKIWSNDHNPPHFHVLSDGWDIVVEINTGNILKTKVIGKDSKVYSYVEKNIKNWLDDKSAINKKLTNKESAQFLWDSNNS